MEEALLDDSFSNKIKPRFRSDVKAKTCEDAVVLFERKNNEWNVAIVIQNRLLISDGPADLYQTQSSVTSW